MPLTCIVVNCGSRALRDRVSFFAVPKALNFAHATELNELSAQRREQWINAIKRDDLTESILKYEKVCSKHFITGTPADLKDVHNPDWVPNQNMVYSTEKTLKRRSDLLIAERVQKRSKTNKISECVDEIVEDEAAVTNNAELESIDGVSTQTTEIIGNDLEQQAAASLFAATKIDELSRRLAKTMLTYESLENDNQKCLFYTGLKFDILKSVYRRIQLFIPSTSVSALEPHDQFLLTLMKFRLNLYYKDLAYRFGISATTCSTYFDTIISILYQRFKNIIIWPERENLQKNVPSCFRAVFHDKTTIVLDCFEVFIEKPSNYLTQQLCWSNYKHHNTVKFLIGITTQGTVSFISKAWGGRTLDKQIVELSGILDKIKEPVDAIRNRGN